MLKRILIPVAVVAMLAANVPAPVAAQASEGTLFLTKSLISAPTGDAGTRVYAATDSAPEAGTARMGWGFYALTYATQWRFEATQDSVLSGSVTGTFNIRCELPAAFQVPSASGATSRFTFFHDGASLGAITIATEDIECMAGEERTFEGSIDVDGTAVEAGDQLVAEFTLWVANAPPGIAEHVVMLVGGESASGVRGVGLPGSAPSVEPSAPDDVTNATQPQVIEERSNESQLGIQHAFSNATDNAYRIAWMAPAGHLDITYAVAVENGSVAVRLLSEDGTEAFNETFSSNTTADAIVPLGNLTAGNWTLQIDYDAFVGTLDFGVATSAEAAADSQSADFAREALRNRDEVTPGPTLGLVLVAGLVGAAWASRRRD